MPCVWKLDSMPSLEVSLLITLQTVGILVKYSGSTAVWDLATKDQQTNLIKLLT